MSIIRNSVVPASGATGYNIEQSLRFNDNDSAYLSRTGVTPTNNKKCTFSFWLKRTNLGLYCRLFGGANSTNGRDSINLNNDKINVYTANGAAAYGGSLSSLAVLRDVSSWYHIVIAFDTTQATSTDRVKLYINGLPTSVNFDVAFPLNCTLGFNSSNLLTIGTDADGSPSEFADCYLAEVNFIDGQALTPDYFGEFDATYGHWKPIKYDGSYGTNGFYLPFNGKATKHIISLTGNGVLTNTESKFGGYSLGITSALGKNGVSISNSSNFDFGSGDFTIDWWEYRTTLTAQSVISRHDTNGATATAWALGYPNGGNLGYLLSGSSGSWTIANNINSGLSINLNEWTHYALVRNGSEIAYYKNGVKAPTTITTTSSLYVPSTGVVVGYGVASSAALASFGGYIDELRIVKGVAKWTGNFTPDTSPYTDTDYPTVLLAHFDNTLDDETGVLGGIGNDQSGQENHFTTNNLSATDIVLDSPTNNFATLNVLAPLQTTTLSEGSLKVGSDGNGVGNSTITIPIGSKAYFEAVVTSASTTLYIGIQDTDHPTSTLGGSDTNIKYYANGKKWIGSVETLYGSSYGSVGDVIGVAVDNDIGIVTFYKNGVSQGDITIPNQVDFLASLCHVTASGQWVVNFGQDSSFAGNKTPQGNTDANGIGDFYYPVPSGYLALCTANLPEPSVVPREHFDIRTRTGTSGVVTINDILFPPDLIWIKGRSNANPQYIANIISGANKFLGSDTTNAENTSLTQELTAFNNDGYTLGTSPNGYVNYSPNTYVDWLWKAGGTPVTNTDGSITSQVSANVDAGMSLVAFTGNLTAGATVGHGLLKAPEFMIFKGRSTTYNWTVYHKDIGETKELFLNLTNSAGSDDTWNYTTPTSSVVSLGANNYSNNGSTIAMCFHSVDGYSKIGSYIGNSSVDGTFVYCGFRPKYVMIKRTDVANSWIILDVERSIYNVTNDSLIADGANAEFVNETSHAIDILSNGFKIKADGTATAVNASGGTYIFMAFAEHPFKYTNGR